MVTVEFSNRQGRLSIDFANWEQWLTKLFHAEGIGRGEISVSIVRDDEIHALNREYLAHDYPTDVLSFVLDRRGDELFGEIVISSDQAASRCHEFGRAPADELELYLIHGALHLVGYDDKSTEDRQRMRERERYYMAQRHT